MKIYLVNIWNFCINLIAQVIKTVLTIKHHLFLVLNSLPEIALVNHLLLLQSILVLYLILIVSFQDICSIKITFCGIKNISKYKYICSKSLSPMSLRHTIRCTAFGFEILFFSILKY